MTQFTVTRTGVQAYTEQGGTAPASFDSQLHTANESRLGMTAGRPIDQKTQWLLHSEWAHRFDDESSRVSGNANVLESIMVPYAFNGNPTKQDWMRFRSELIHDLNEFQRLSIAGTVATIGQDPDLTLSMQWNSLF